MNGKLNIYACSGVGQVGDQIRYDYWLDGTSTLTNTQAVNSLLARINLLYAETLYLPELTDEQVSERLDQIDMLSLALAYAQQLHGNSEELHRAGLVLGSMVADGQFSCNSTDYDERSANLDRLFAEAKKRMQRDSIVTDEEYMQWWNDMIIDRDCVGLTDEQIERAVAAGQKISGYEENVDLAKYLNNASEYFLYTYFTDAQLNKLPYVIKRKAKTQRDIYNYCKAVYVAMYGSEAEMKSIIHTGIIGYFGQSPEAVVKTMYDEYLNSGSVGNIEWTATAIVEIIGAIFTFIVGVVAAICTAVANVKIAEAQEVDIKAAQAAVPGQEDWPSDWSKDLPDSLKNNSLLWIGGAALAAWLILRK